jgi:hypothetical protein
VDPISNPFDDSEANGSDKKVPELREPNVIEAILKNIGFFIWLVIFLPDHGLSL